MPHGLGSGSDFGHSFEPEPQPENPDAPVRNLEDLVAESMATEAENLGPEPEFDEDWPVTDDPEHEDGFVQSMPVEALQELIYQAGQRKAAEPTQILIYPDLLTLLVHHEILSIEEARLYLRTKYGVELR